MSVHDPVPVVGYDPADASFHRSSWRVTVKSAGAVMETSIVPMVVPAVAVAVGVNCAAALPTADSTPWLDAVVARTWKS